MNRTLIQKRNIYAIVRIFGNRDYVKHVQTESDRFRSIERVSLFDWQCAERPDRSPRKRLRHLFVVLTRAIVDSRCA